MNKIILMGRLTKDPEIRWTTGNNPVQIATYTLAVDRAHKTQDKTADFFFCKTFAKGAEFAEKYLTKGKKILVTGNVQTGSYEKNGQRFYTFEVVVESHEFAESKGAEGKPEGKPEVKTDSDGFISVPEGIDDELPFN